MFSCKTAWQRCGPLARQSLHRTTLGKDVTSRRLMSSSSGKTGAYVALTVSCIGGCAAATAYAYRKTMEDRRQYAQKMEQIRLSIPEWRYPELKIKSDDDEEEAEEAEEAAPEAEAEAAEAVEVLAEVESTPSAVETIVETVAETVAEVAEAVAEVAEVVVETAQEVAEVAQEVEKVAEAIEAAAEAVVAPVVEAEESNGTTVEAEEATKDEA